jgi:hypothetical protein
MSPREGSRGGWLQRRGRRRRLYGGGRAGRDGGLGARTREGNHAIYSQERGCAAPSLRREGFLALMP